MPVEGEISELAAERIAVLNEQNDMLLDDIDSLERELRKYRAEVKRLRKEQDRQIRNHPQYEKALKVLMYWRAVCAPSAREVESVRRVRPCLDRLAGGYTVKELCRAVDGYALKPYVVGGKRTHEGPKDSWYADAELIFRDEKRVDVGLAIADQANVLRTALSIPSGRVSGKTLDELSDLGKAAQRLAAHGLPVFPCRARDKKPATRNGLKDATTDLRRIEAAWRRWPDLNIGVPTGAVSGVVVLDVDGDDGQDSLHYLEDEHEVLPDTKSITTPSGGQHFWFKHPDKEIRNTAGYPERNLDIRGDGGYVLVPPSIGPNGVGYFVDDESPMTHMPAWLVKMLRDYQAKADQALKGSIDWPAFLADAPSQGERDTRMTKYVGHLFRVGMDTREAYATAALLNALSKPPMADKQLAKIVQSIARRDRR
jgi:hypothetical protein